jgi:tetratricopeptide (TPR) repeat protein
MRAFLVFFFLFISTANAGPPSFWQTVASPNQQGLLALQSAQYNYRRAFFDQAREQAQLARELAPSLEADFVYSMATFHAIFISRQFDTHLACAEVMFLLDSVRERSLPLGQTLEAHLALGICAAVVGEYERSIEESTLYAYHPNATNLERAQGLINLGDAQMASQDLSGAIRSYSESARVFSSEPYVWFALAVAYYRNHEIQSATASIQKAISLDLYADSFDSAELLFVPEEEEFFYRAIAAAGRGDAGAAHSYLGEYLSLSPEGAYRQRAMEAFVDVDTFTTQMSMLPEQPAPTPKKKSK